MIKSLIDKLIASVIKWFSEKKPKYELRVTQLKQSNQTELADKIEKAVIDGQSRLDSIHRNWKSGNSGVISTLWNIRALKNKFSELDESLKPSWRQFIESVVFIAVVVFVLRHFIFGLYHVPTGSAEPNILVGDRIVGLKYPYYFTDIKRGDLVIFDKPDFVYSDNLINRLWQKYVGIYIPIIGLSEGPESWVKRVIGLPGDVVEGRVEDGKTEIYLNGEKLIEPYLNPYPLIAVRRSSGFFSPELGMPSFLTWKSKVEEFTYDPSKPYDNQPFFQIDKDEVVCNQFTGKPFLLEPRSPAYYDKFPPKKVPTGKLWCMGDNRKNSYDCRNWGFLDSSLVCGRASRILWSIDSTESFWLFDIIKHPINFFTKKFRWSRIGRSLHPFEKIPSS